MDTTPRWGGTCSSNRIQDLDALVDAPDRVAGGGSALDPEVIAGLLVRRRPEEPLAARTPREREVLALMAAR